MSRNATHESLAHGPPVKRSSDRSFGLLFAAVFGAVGLWPLFDSDPPRYWALGLAAAFAVVASMRPAWLRHANDLWIKLGLLMGRVVNPIVLGLLFYLVITPFGLVARLFGKDLLRLRIDRTAKSYWIERTPPGPAPETMRQQF
jgi:predicted membrane metal-binding protein